MKILILVLFTVGLLFGFLLVSSPAFGYTASKFVADYGYELSDGQKIKVLVKVKGEPESEDPAKRAKEIRFLQSAVLKFCNFAGATNVKSDTWNNEFTAIVTTSLAQILEQRSDVISVQVIEAPVQLPPKLQELFDENDIAKLPFWIQKTINWYNQGKISEAELINAIKYLAAKSSHVENTDKCYREKFPIDWSGCNLYGKVLPNIDYRYANLSNANLAGAIFSGKDLSNADLSGAFLKYAEIDNANLTNADLSNANIIRGWVRGSDLSNANLSGAYLWNTDFTSSNLTNVNFQDTTLTYAILAGTDLKDANLDGAGTWSTNLNDCYNHPICE